MSRGRSFDPVPARPPGLLEEDERLRMVGVAHRVHGSGVTSTAGVAQRAAIDSSDGSAPPARSTAPRALLLAVTIALGGCASGGAAPARATDAEWRALAAPRPVPLPGAARVAIDGVELAGPLPWTDRLPVAPELAVEELVVTGLLRRRDVHFVERRRFLAAAAAERAGAPRPSGAPRAGVSPGAELMATAVWHPLAPSESTVEVRLTDATTGVVRATAREALPGAPAPVPLARAVVAALRAGLASLGRLPPWEDPIAEGGGTNPGADVSADGVLGFMRGLAAEERWAWEEARRAYRAAASENGFHEAAAALARAARLRLGGTLGAS